MILTKEQLQEKFSLSRIILPLLLGLSIICYMLYRDYEPGQRQLLLKASPFWVGVALLVLFVRDFGYMYRIRSLTGKVLSWKQSFQVIMLWEFASCALPSVVGGSTIAAYILFKEKIALGKSVAQVMATAMLDNVYFVLAVPLVFLISREHVLPEMAGISEMVRQSLLITFLVSYLLIALYAFVMLYALIINPKVVKRVLLRAGQLKLFRKWRQALFCHANELLIASKHLRAEGAAYWFKAGISTALVWTARYAIIGCIIAAFANLDIQNHFIVFARNLFYKIVLLMSVTPGGAGIAEVTFPAFFGTFIGGFTTIVVLVYRLLTYYLYLIAGTIVFPRWAARVFTNDAAAAEPAPVMHHRPLPHSKIPVQPSHDA